MGGKNNNCQASMFNGCSCTLWKILNEREWHCHSAWEKMWFASHLKFIFYVGMGFTFLLNILFLFENGKPIRASSEWNFHFQMKYPFWDCSGFIFHPIDTENCMALLLAGSLMAPAYCRKYYYRFQCRKRNKKDVCTTLNMLLPCKAIWNSFEKQELV